MLRPPSLCGEKGTGLPAWAEGGRPRESYKRIVSDITPGPLRLATKIRFWAGGGEAVLQESLSSQQSFYGSAPVLGGSRGPRPGTGVSQTLLCGMEDPQTWCAHLDF